MKSLRNAASLAAILILLSTRTVAEPEGWEPKGPYWKGYRTVFVAVVCDSTGHAISAELMYSYASPGETDSILARAATLVIDPRGSTGRMWWRTEETPFDPSVHYIVPFVTPGPDTGGVRIPVTRRELEIAGLGPWLAIWDDLLPDWPFESWRTRWTNRLQEYSPEAGLRDSALVSMGMVSTSGDGAWRLHPFGGAEFGPDGKIGFDVDSGYVLYRRIAPWRVRQYTDGTTTAFNSAEWIDDARFAIPAIGEATVGYAGKAVSYRMPILIFGHVDSLIVMGIGGPPIPVETMAVVQERLDAYVRARYPKYWEASR